MAAASVVQNWETGQTQSSRMPTSRIPSLHVYSYYNKSDQNTDHHTFSHNGNIPILDRSQDNHYNIARPLSRINPRSASAINMNHIYMQHHRPYASVISPGYLRQELKYSIHSREHHLISSRFLQQIHQQSSGKHTLNKRLSITSNNKNHGNSFSNLSTSYVYDNDPHISNITFQTENARILHYYGKINNIGPLKSPKSSESDTPLHTNNRKSISDHSLSNDIDPDINNDTSKIKNLEIKTLQKHDKNTFPPETGNTGQNVSQDVQPSHTKSFKAKILNVFSFSSLSSLDTINSNNMNHAKNYTYSQRTSNDMNQLNNINIDSDIYSFSEKSISLDNISILSTASSASIMLRKVSKEGKGMFKKSKRALSSILRGSLHFENSKSTISKNCRENIMENVNKIEVEIKNMPDSPQGNTEDSKIIKKEDKDDLLIHNLDDDTQEQRESIYMEKDIPVSQLVCGNMFVGSAPVNDPIKENGNSQSTYFKSFPPTKKGILKYTGWSSTMPNFKPSHSLTDFTIRFTPPTSLELITFDDVPNTLSSAETSFARNTKSLSFSPKITIYDTWPSFEYDRRGEIATCNRLTPVLAQRIKEELNTYKLDEMIVHEQTVGKNKRLSKSKKGVKKKVVDPFLRKDWYDLKAPSVFEVRQIGKTLVNRTTGLKNANDSLRGRVIEVSLADLQKDEEHAFRKIKLQIADVQGKNCLTNFYGMLMTSDKLRSLVRRWQTLIEANQDVKTTDGYVLRLFVIGFTKRRANQIKKTTYAQTSQIRQIRKKMCEVMQKEASSCSMKDLIQKFILEVIGREITKSTQGIFPLQNVFIRKVKIIKMPRLDMSKLLELHGESIEDTGVKLSKDFKELEILDSV
ncbi:hypothetical protein PCANB_000453 [Pneumocystis canis]|nr:hypothetical protein PCK1_000497 [Pneumocystis canis]KAG5437740.1 hypothetical protein PCANB_000453 [Pneumocystis canis]